MYIVKDEERMAKLEEDLKQVRNKAEEADKKYDEVSKKLQITEGELEKAEERGENGEMKIMELEEELKVVATNLKSLEVSEEKANQREIANKEQVKNLTAKLKQAEARAEFAEKSVQKLNMEVMNSFFSSVSGRLSRVCFGFFYLSLSAKRRLNLTLAWKADSLNWKRSQDKQSHKKSIFGSRSFTAVRTNKYKTSQTLIFTLSPQIHTGARFLCGQKEIHRI